MSKVKEHGERKKVVSKVGLRVEWHNGFGEREEGRKEGKEGERLVDGSLCWH